MYAKRHQTSTELYIIKYLGTSFLFPPFENLTFSSAAFPHQYYLPISDFGVFCSFFLNPKYKGKKTVYILCEAVGCGYVLRLLKASHSHT